MKWTGLVLVMVSILAVDMSAQAALANVKAGVEAYHAGDYKRAIDEWMPAAAKNDPDALFNLGQVYRLGKGVKPDLNVAESYYLRAAELGHVVAQANLGALYLDRHGPLFDPKKGLTWLRKASNHGNALARYMLGVVYFNGEYVPEDYIEAYALISLAAKQGVEDAVKAEQTVVSQMSIQEISAGKLRAEAIAKQTDKVIAEAAAAHASHPPASAPAAQPPVIQASASEPSSSDSSKAWVNPDLRPSSDADKLASRTPPAAAPALSTSPASAADTPVSGFGIQVASLKSETGARAEWKSLVAAHPDLLSDLAMNVQRADLGDKGVYYRLQAGSFTSLAEAKAMCGKLKDANVPCLPVSR